MRLAHHRFNLILALAALLMLVLFLTGPITQPPGYHRFADSASWLGIDNAADVLSNLGFLGAGVYGLTLGRTSPAWKVFFCSLILTACGSAWYHLAPDNARLVFDRIPIALACASLLAAVLNEGVHEALEQWLLLLGLCLFGVASVGWWSLTQDLRPYLLLQVAPLLLIPVLQWLADAPRAQRRAFGYAIGLYVLAKLFEVQDSAILHMTACISGHTAKHVAATVAAVILVRNGSAHVRVVQAILK